MLLPNAKSAQDANTRKSSKLEVNMSELEIRVMEPEIESTDWTEGIKVNKLFNKESLPSQASEKFPHSKQCSFTTQALKGILFLLRGIKITKRVINI